MRKQKFIYAVAIVATLFLSACSSDSSSDTDNQKPSITIFKPLDGDIIIAGQDMLVDIDFTDNVGLASYKIDIHYAGDGHVHRKKDGQPQQEWTYEYSEYISGKAVSKELAIPVPFGTSGEYHFGVYAIDTSGNQALIWEKITIFSN